MIFPILSCNFALCIANDAYMFKITWCRLISMDIYNICYIKHVSKIHKYYIKLSNLPIPVSLSCGATKLGILLIS